MAIKISVLVLAKVKKYRYRIGPEFLYHCITIIYIMTAHKCDSISLFLSLFLSDFYILRLFPLFAHVCLFCLSLLPDHVIMQEPVYSFLQSVPM